jgi:hypothetical protein
MLDAALWWLRVPAFYSIRNLCWVGGERACALLGWCLEIIVVDVDDWDGLVRKEAVGSFVEHPIGIVAHDWLCLEVEISHHSVMRMLLRSTPPWSKAIAPPARSDWALTSDALMPV